MSKKIQEVIKTLSCFLMIILTVISIAAVLWRLLAKSIDAMDGTAFYWANEFELLVLNWVVVLGMMIETAGEYCRGTTVGDILGFSGHAPNADVLLDVDRDRFADLLVEAIRFYGEEHA